jgi:hypothetical protein
VYSLRAPQRFLAMEGDDTSVALVGSFVQSFVMKSLSPRLGRKFIPSLSMASWAVF